MGIVHEKTENGKDSGKIVTVDEGEVKRHLDEIVRGTVEETLNSLLEAEAESALMLVAARLRHIAGTRWGTKRYLDMKRLRESEYSEEASDAASPVATPVALRAPSVATG